MMLTVGFVHLTVGQKLQIDRGAIMKTKLILLALLLLSTPCLAAVQTQHLAVIARQSVASGESCSGDQIFGWSMEDFDLTSGTPAGCSSHATTTVTASGATIVSSPNPQDGTYSLNTDATADYAQIALAGVNGDVGTLDTYVQFPSSLPVANVFILQIIYDVDNNRISLAWNNGTDNFQFSHKGGGNYNQVESTGTIVADTWYHIVGKWDKSEAGGYSLSISIDGGTAVTSTANLTSLAAAPNLIKWMNNFTDKTVLHDLTKVYSTWQ